LVTGAAGQLVGEISVDVLVGIPSDRWSEIKVGTLMSSIDPMNLIPADRNLLQAIEQLELNQLAVLTVVREDGSPMGLLEKTAIVHLIQQRSTVAPA
jgi:predicted transcriptional regulator